MTSAFLSSVCARGQLPCRAVKRTIFLSTLVGLAVLVGLPTAAGAAEEPTPEQEVALFDASTGRWRLRYNDGRVYTFFYGVPGDTPLMGDWDCDGEDTVAMYRESNGFVYLRNSNEFGVAEEEFFFGIAGDIPIAGDWDGDGCDTFGILRGGKAFLSNELGTRLADIEFFFGVPGDRPFAGDWDGDGLDTLGQYRRSNGFAYTTSVNPDGGVAPTDNSFFYGIAGDAIFAGDWDGDGDDSVGIYRPSDATFYLSNDNRQGIADIVIPFGQAGWLPTAGELGAARGLPDLALEPIASGFSRPIFLVSPPGDDRLFVVEQRGRIEIIENGVVDPVPFLDLSSLVSQGGSEQGLLGLAFHPSYATNSTFYVHYTTAAGGDSRVVEYVGSSPIRTLLSVEQPFTNHNGGMLQFGPDGRLFVGLGDGGSGGDPLDHGQNAATELGSIVAIDIDSGATEIWAIGLRNPWRFDFDGDLIYVGDVGQNEWEEISVAPFGDGLNFGWNIFEGPDCFAGPCDTAGLNGPTVAVDHGEGCSITGGFVYRGSAIPSLLGTYLYSDFCSGYLRGFTYEGGSIVQVRDWTADVGGLGSVTSFGEDAAGELYVLTIDGSVSRIVAG